MPSLFQKHAHEKGQRSNHHILKFQPKSIVGQKTAKPLHVLCKCTVLPEPLLLSYRRPLPGTGPVAQLVTCLATDASLTVNPGSRFRSRPGPILLWRLIDHETISTVILLPFADSFKKGCCQLQAKVCA